ncbi:hypothetical protein EVAR_34692_1 [Eumeta japonica]|uniref:Uncharacterized protein n=1 Tax=Eumeta variegata TaxID=151549 RepID=A0A4C1XGX9_EUMVA|nr:hypothetical protein EVAR_34692_1 [Eumeta japonica]
MDLCLSELPANDKMGKYNRKEAARVPHLPRPSFVSPAFLFHANTTLYTGNFIAAKNRALFVPFACRDRRPPLRTARARMTKKKSLVCQIDNARLSQDHLSIFTESRAQ